MPIRLQEGVATQALAPIKIQTRKKPSAKMLVIGRTSDDVKPGFNVLSHRPEKGAILSADYIACLVTVLNGGYIVGPYRLLKDIYVLNHPVYVKDADDVGHGGLYLDMRFAFESVVAIPGDSGLGVTQIPTDLEPSFTDELARISFQGAIWDPQNPFFAQTKFGFLTAFGKICTEDGISGRNASVEGAPRFHGQDLDGVMGANGHSVYIESILACIPANLTQ